MRRSTVNKIHLFTRVLVTVVAGLLTIRTRSSGTAKSTARPSCLVDLLYYISGERKSVNG